MNCRFFIERRGVPGKDWILNIKHFNDNSVLNSLSRSLNFFRRENRKTACRLSSEENKNFYNSIPPLRGDLISYLSNYLSMKVETFISIRPTMQDSSVSIIDTFSRCPLNKWEDMYCLFMFYVNIIFKMKSCVLYRSAVLSEDILSSRYADFCANILRNRNCVFSEDLILEGDFAEACRESNEAFLSYFCIFPDIISIMPAENIRRFRLVLDPETCGCFRYTLMIEKDLMYRLMSQMTTENGRSQVSQILNNHIEVDLLKDISQEEVFDFYSCGESRILNLRNEYFRRSIDSNFLSKEYLKRILDSKDVTVEILNKIKNKIDKIV
ncbi:MAG: hypothetical protein ACOCV1_02535 [Bacillota bacterium]